MSVTFYLRWFGPDDLLVGELEIERSEAEIKAAVGDLSKGPLRDCWPVTGDNLEAVSGLVPVPVSLHTFSYDIVGLGQVDTSQ